MIVILVIDSHYATICLKSISFPLLVRGGNLLWDSCSENSMHRGVWWVAVQGVTKSRTQHTHKHKTSSPEFTDLYNLAPNYCIHYHFNLKPSDPAFILPTFCHHFHLSPHKVKSISHVHLFATPWTVAYQASPSTGFARQEYWSGLPFPSPFPFLQSP